MRTRRQQKLSTTWLLSTAGRTLRDSRGSHESYDAGPPFGEYVEVVTVGDELPEMPLFLQPGECVPAPLMAAYEEAGRVFPRPFKKLLTGA